MNYCSAGSVLFSSTVNTDVLTLDFKPAVLKQTKRSKHASKRCRILCKNVVSLLYLCLPESVVIGELRTQFFKPTNRHRKNVVMKSEISTCILLYIHKRAGKRKKIQHAFRDKRSV